MDEVHDAIDLHQQIERWSRFSASSLTFAQYVVGGSLATSFIQKSLSPEIVGVLGVIVVGASIASQRYRPDVRSRAAALRRRHLQHILREAEDLQFARKTGHPDAPTELEIVRLLSRGLTEVDRIDLDASDANEQHPPKEDKPPESASKERH